MQPFYFGPATRLLFGVYHPPVGARRRDEGVVCCAPLGHEYLRAYRAFRQLAERLAADGYHVLRFDYSATGDSALDSEAARLSDWREDLRTSCQELRDLAGVDRLALVGLRFGALLAAEAAAADRDVRTLVLWDPVVSGPAYMEGLVVMDEERRRQFGAGAGRSATHGVVSAGDTLLGFGMSAPLREAIARTALPPVNAIGAAGRVAVVLGSHSPAMAAWRDAGAAGAAEGLWRPVSDSLDWDDVSKVGGAIFAGAALDAICAAIRGGT